MQHNVGAAEDLLALSTVPNVALHVGDARQGAGWRDDVKNHHRNARALGL